MRPGQVGYITTVRARAWRWNLIRWRRLFVSAGVILVGVLA
jgi:hypothetical protein